MEKLSWKKRAPRTVKSETVFETNFAFLVCCIAWCFASIILPGSRISGTQPLQPRPSFWKRMHLNVLDWHEIGACLNVCASRKKTEHFNRTSNECTTNFFFLSIVVESDDYQGSQHVSLRYADIVTLIPMGRRDRGRGGVNVCVRKCVSWGVHWGTIYSMSRGGSQLGLQFIIVSAITNEKKSNILYKS